jgi:hypothetical protein
MKRPKTAIFIAMTDEQAMAVGRMVAQWAYYEHLLNCFLLDLLKLPEAHSIRKRIRSIKIPFDKRMDLWRDLTKVFHSAEPDRATVTDLIQRTATAHGVRDQIVHGIRWALSDRIDVHKHSTLENRAKKTRIVLSADLVMRLRDEIGELSYELNIFYQRFLPARWRSIRL